MAKKTLADLEGERRETVRLIYMRRDTLRRHVDRSVLQAWVDAAEELAAVRYDCESYRRQIVASEALERGDPAGLSRKLAELCARREALTAVLPTLAAALPVAG